MRMIMGIRDSLKRQFLLILITISLFQLTCCAGYGEDASQKKTGGKSETGGVAAKSSESFKEKRQKMVEEQIRARGVTDGEVLKAMQEVPRHEFVPKSYRHLAYADRPLPIGYGQTISQPFIVALMTELLEVNKDSKVLEVGTGSGYQAAVLAEIVDKVYTVEIVEELYKKATKTLTRVGYDNVHTRYGDGYYGWKEHAPYDAIIVTAAAEFVPPPLVKQLKVGGKMCIPVGPPFRTQKLLLVTRKGPRDVKTKVITMVRFVPLTREKK